MMSKGICEIREIIASREFTKLANNLKLLSIQTVTIISQEWVKVFQFCYAAKVPHARGRTDLILDKIRFKMADLRQQGYETFFWP